LKLQSVKYKKCVKNYFYFKVVGFSQVFVVVKKILNVGEVGGKEGKFVIARVFSGFE